MSKPQESDNPDLLKFSISCSDVPDTLLDKTVAKHYFQQFGKVLRIRIRTKQKVCIVEFANVESADRAFSGSGDHNGQYFNVAWTKPKSAEKRKHRKKSQDADWPNDADIQAELDAMKGTFSTSRTYNLRPEGMQVEASQTVIKKSVTKKKTPVKSRQWKNDKIVSKIKTIDSSPQISDQESELLSLIMSSCASTSEEKFRILDARDKLLRLRTVRQSELSRAIRTVGTCPDMCPEKERLMREVQHQVSSFEAYFGNRGTMDHTLAVKQYSRSSADQEAPLAHELRPVAVLQLTMGYLLHRIVDLCDAADVNLAEWFHFVWDRTRGIRKDVTQQELCCMRSVNLVEQCARFHIHCAARLVAEDLSVFDEKINTENLTKCLQTLKYMYHDLRVKQGVLCPNEAEFRAYIVLLNLNDGNFMWEVQQLSAEIQQSRDVKFALKVYSALDKNNYVQFFKLVHLTTYLNACILLRYFNQVRYRALLTILKSYSPRTPCTQFPTSDLHRILAFEDLDNTVAFLEYHCLQLNQDKTHVFLDRRQFMQPDGPFALDRAINVVESKRQVTVGETVNGAPLPERNFEKHVPHDSFDEKGRLRLAELPKDFQDKYQLVLGEFPANQRETEEKVDPQTECKPEPVKKIFPFVEDQSFTSANKIEANIPFAKSKSPVIDLTEPDGEVSSIFAPFKGKNLEESQLHTTKSDAVKTAPTTSTTSTKFWSDAKTIPDANKPSIFGNEKRKNRPLFSEEKPEEKFTFLRKESEKKSFQFLQSNSNSSSDFSFTKNSFTSQVIQPIVELPPVITAENIAFKPITRPEIVVQPAADLLEKERKMKEALIKRQKDIQEKEIKRQAEKMRIAELKHLEHMKQKRAAEIFELKIKSEVGSILNDLLQKVENQLIENRLKEISNNIRQRKALQFGRRWRNLTRISRKKRKNFFDNPVWISSKSVTAEAEELYTPSQKLTLHNMKRYKLGTPTDIQLKQTKHIETIDVYKLVWKVLFERSNLNADFLCLNLFWKIGVSIPDIQENFCVYAVEEKLNCAFHWTDNLKCLLKKQFSNNGGSLSYCIKKLTKLENNLNGLLFINIGDLSALSIKRFSKMIDKNQKISFPVVILLINNFDYNNRNVIVQQLKINQLVNNGVISDYHLFHVDENNFGDILNLSLQFLATNFKMICPIEMDAVSSALRIFIGEELWFRIRSSAEVNSSLGLILQDPNIIIDLYNQALKYSLEILLNKHVYCLPNFPAEFKEFLVKQDQILLPCTYHYFPDYWNSKSYLTKVRKSIESLKLPQFSFEWPPHSELHFQQILTDYCAKAFKDPTTIVLKILSVVLGKINQNQIGLISWLDIIQLIVIEKLTTTQFCDKTHSVYTVAYKVDEVKAFRQNLWWYRVLEDENVKKRIAAMQCEEQHSESELFYITDDEENDYLDVDKTLNAMRESDAEENIKMKEDIKELSHLLEDLEESMEIQKKIMLKFQDKAIRALE